MWNFQQSLANYLRRIFFRIELHLVGLQTKMNCFTEFLTDEIQIILFGIMRKKLSEYFLMVAHEHYH